MALPYQSGTPPSKGGELIYSTYRFAAYKIFVEPTLGFWL